MVGPLHSCRRFIIDMSSLPSSPTGFFSAGLKLIDGSPDNASAIMTTDMPEYVCDGAHTRSDACVVDRS